MTVELALIISIVSVGFSIYTGVANMKRNNRNDERSDATQLTTVIVKLENISAGISDIKSDMRNIKDEVKELRDRLIQVEDSTKSAHHRISELRLERGGESND